MIRPKKETEQFLLPITKNYETLIKQTHRKATELLELEANKSRETFYFNPPISIEGSWVIRLTSLEIYNSTFNINKTNKNFELYTDKFDKFSFEELKDELEGIFNISHITPYHLQHETIEPRIIEAYNKYRLEESSTNGYIKILMGYARSRFRDFETNFRFVVVLDENDFQLQLEQNNSNFVTYELSPGLYTIKNFHRLFTLWMIMKEP